MTIDSAEDRRVFVDPSVAPGGSARYSVVGSASGAVGEPSAEVVVNRPLTDPVPVADSTLVRSTTGSAGTMSSSTDGATFHGQTASGGIAQIFVGGTSSPFGLSLTPLGPGVYDTLGHGPTPEYPIYLHSDDASCGTTEPAAERIQRLIVRQALYDQELVPLVLDASVLYRCPGTSAVRQVEIRFHSDGDVARLSASPVALTPPVSHVGVASSALPVTFTNDGPDALTLGDPVIEGAAAGDWQPAAGSCTGTLASGASCGMSVVFTPSTDRARNATLNLPTGLDGRPGPQFLVPLSGYGGGAPVAPELRIAPTIDRIGVHVQRPTDEGGYPTTSYALQRRVDNGAWTSLGPVDPVTGRYVDADVTTGHEYAYRATATNEVGTSSYSSTAPEEAWTFSSALAASQLVFTATREGGPHSLRAMSWTYSHVAIEEDGHEHTTPAVSWGGTQLVYARAATAGVGQQDYDLWSRPLRGGGPLKLTSAAGAETQPALSPDGRRVAFTSTPVGGPASASSVWIVPVDGSSGATKVADGAANPTWRIDGRSVVVEDLVDPASGLDQVDVITKARSSVAGTQGGTQPAISRTGTLAYLTAAGDVAFGTNATIHYGAAGYLELDDLAWGVDGKLFASGPAMLVEIESPSSSSQASPTDEYGDRQPVPARLDTVQPSVSASVAIMGPRAVVSVSRSDDATPEAGLTQTCALDGGPAVTCGASWTTPDLGGGSHTVSIVVRDEAGNTKTYSQSFLIDQPDVSAPLADAPRGLPVLTTKGSVTFRYSGTDDSGPPASYDLRYRTRTPRAGFGAYVRPAGWASRTSTTATLNVAPGREYCVSVRAKDSSGNVSAWGAERCTATPLDDRAFKRSAKGWKSTGGSADFRGTVTKAKRKGAVLSYPGVTARSVSLVATTCAKCGRVDVYVGGTYVGRADLRSKKTRHAVVVAVPTSARLTGKVRIVVRSGTPRIDGLVLRRG